jgi:hypothetical protein
MEKRTGWSITNKLERKNYETERNKAKNVKLSLNFQKGIGEIQEL